METAICPNCNCVVVLPENRFEGQIGNCPHCKADVMICDVIESQPRLELVRKAC
jgi:uncharacterized paraquat-inducible protein A